MYLACHLFCGGKANNSPSSSTCFDSECTDRRAYSQMVHCCCLGERDRESMGCMPLFNEIRFAHFEEIANVWETKKEGGWCRSLVQIKPRVQNKCPSEVYLWENCISLFAGMSHLMKKHILES